MNDQLAETLVDKTERLIEKRANYYMKEISAETNTADKDQKVKDVPAVPTININNCSSCINIYGMCYKYLYKLYKYL